MNVIAAQKAISSDPGIRTGDHQLRTFTIGFNEPTDELDDAKIIAEFAKTRHTEETLPRESLKKLGDVITSVEEPKVNILQGYLLAEVAGRDVKVLLSGLGGDELFAGYDIHRFCNTLGKGHHFTPAWLQKSVFGPMGSVWWSMQHASGALKYEHYRIGGQIALSIGDRAQFYARLRNAWDYDAKMYERVYHQPEAFRGLPKTGQYFEPYFSEDGTYLDQVLRAELQTKMVNDFLLNEDRVTSAHGVEGRVPFLNKELVEFCMSIPAHEKMSGTGTKQLWKDAIGDALPQEILNKTKQGFTFSSYHQWTKDLQDLVKIELTEEWCEDPGLFQYAFIEQLLDYPPHANLRWHYFMAWMMLGVKKWIEVFDVQTHT